MTGSTANERTSGGANPAVPGAAMYVAGFGICLCAFSAASIGFPIPDELFLAVTILSGIGFIVNYLTRSKPTAGWTIAALVACLIAVLWLDTAAGESWTMFGVPGSEDLAPRSTGVALCWMLVLFSFSLLGYGWFLFLTVPAAAVMGLVAIAYTGPEFMFLFILFVGLTSFMLVQENLCRLQMETSSHEGSSGEPPVRSQLLLAGTVSAGAALFGYIMAVPLQRAVEGLSPFTVNAAQVRPEPGQRTTEAPVVSELDDIQVGEAGTTGGDYLVMRVRAEHGAYWRGGAFSIYTGRGWRRGVQGVWADLVRARGEVSDTFDTRGRTYLELQVPLTPHNATPGRTHLLRQLIYLESRASFTALYGAGEPRRHRLPENAAFGLPLGASVDEAGTVTLTRPIATTAYEVISEVADWDEEDLRQRSARMEGPLQSQYTALGISEAARRRLIELARNITREARNDFDRAKAIEAFLARTCAYNREAGGVPDPDEDVVLQFVENVREGHCQLFATAHAVLCRAAGLPSRVASGFLSGLYDSESMTYFVRERDKHLWSEVWFDGVGWVQFDPTTDARDVTPSEEDRQSAAGIGWLKTLLSRGPVPLVMGLTALFLVAWAVLSEVRRTRRARRAAIGDLSPWAVQTLQAYLTLGGRLRRFGLGRASWETPQEHCSRMADEFRRQGLDDSAVNEMCELVVRARYAGEPLGPAEAQLAWALARQIASSAKMALRSGRRGLWKKGLPGVEAR